MSSTPDTTGNFSGDSGDEYEENVRQQRAENAALLASLDLHSGGSAVVDPEGAKERRVDAAAEERRKKRAAAQRQKAAEERKKRRRVEEVAAPARSSARLKGRTPAGLEEENKRLEEEAKQMEIERREAARVLHERHDLAALFGVEEAASHDSDDDEAGDEGKSKPAARLTNADMAQRLQAVWADVLGDVATADDEDDKKASKSNADGFESLRSAFADVSLLATNKVTPKRIYTAAFHPNTRRDVVFTGDKNGTIGVWEPLAPRQDGNDDEDEDEDGPSGSDGLTYNLRIPHDSSPISCIKIPPTDPTKLFSSSYNSTLRRIDLENGASEEVFGFDGDDDGGALLSVFDFQRSINVAGSESADDAIDSRVVWCGDHRGGVIRIDLREGGGGGNARAKRASTKGRNWQRWQVCEKKIGGLSLNPTSPHALSVASLDQSIHIFDTRRLASLDTTSTIPNNYKNVAADALEAAQSDAFTTAHGAQLGYNSSKQASTSVDWSPCGTRLASVSYEDVVRVWDINRDWLDVGAGGGAASTATKSKKPKSSTTPSKSNGLMRYLKREVKEEDADVPVGSARPDDILAKPVVIPHNNQTGKWLTLFRVRFSPLLTHSPHFTIGSMSRHCEIWHAGDPSAKQPPRIVKQLFDPEWTSAVQAVSTFHPRRPARVVSGNASGRCLLWGVRDGGDGEA